MADFVDTPMTGFPDMGESCYDKGGKGSPGHYDGLPGWEGRTPSPNGMSEKFLEEAMPGVQPPATGKDGEQIDR